MLEDLKQRLKDPPTFETVLGMLDEYTAPPEDGDYDNHTLKAMRAVYDIMMNHINKAEEFDIPKNTDITCPHCFTTWVTSEATNALIKCLFCGKMFAVKASKEEG
jgi:hypothetical protein